MLKKIICSIALAASISACALSEPPKAPRAVEANACLSKGAMYYFHRIELSPGRDSCGPLQDVTVFVPMVGGTEPNINPLRESCSIGSTARNEGCTAFTDVTCTALDGSGWKTVQGRMTWIANGLSGTGTSVITISSFSKRCHSMYYVTAVRL